MPYFVKLTTDAASWGWCYTQAIKSQGQIVTLVDPHVPLAGGGRLSLSGGEYPWAKSSGWLHGYYVLAQLPWLPPSSTPIHYPRSVPANAREKGLDAVVDYVLRGSKLRHVYREEAIRRSVAEDLVLDAVSAELRAPTFIPQDDAEFGRWRASRAEAAAYAERDAERVTAEAALEGKLAVIRKRLRIEAHRKLDVAKDQFVSTPCIAPEAFVSIKTAAGPILVGRVKKAVYPQGVGVAPINPRAQNEETLVEVEKALLPGTGDLSGRLKFIQWQQAFAEWEEKYPYPAFAYRHWSDSRPEGLVLRPGLEALGISASELSRVGVFPLISTVARDYLDTVSVTVPSMEECAVACLERTWREAASSAPQ